MNRKRYEREREFGDYRYCIASARSFFFIVPFFCLFVCLFVCLLFVSNWRNIQGGLFNANILIIFISFHAVFINGSMDVCSRFLRIKYREEKEIQVSSLTGEKSNFDQLRESNQDGHVTGSTL